MKKIAVLFASLVFGAGIINAEEKENKIEKLNFGVEVGVHVLTKDVTPPQNVRYNGSDAQAYYVPWHLGVGVEYMFSNGMFGIGSGIRLTNYIAFLGRSNSSRGQSPSAYEWNVDPSSEDGDYVDVRRIKQANNYLGLPVEFRIFFVPVENIVRPYFKLDLAFNFLIANKNTVTFVKEDTPLRYVNLIDENLGKPEKFNSTLDFAYGLRIGRDPFYVNAEIHFPSFLLTDSPVSFFDSSDLTMLNFGAKIGLQVPICWGDYVEKKGTKRQKAAKEQIQAEYAIEQANFETQPAEDDSNGTFTPAQD